MLLSFIDAVFSPGLLPLSHRPVCPQDRPHQELSPLGWCLRRLVILWCVFHVLQNVALMLVVLCCRIWLLVSVVSWEFVAEMTVAFCVLLRPPARWPGCRQSPWRGSSGPFSDSLRLLLPGLPFLSYSRSLGDSPCRRFF